MARLSKKDESAVQTAEQFWGNDDMVAAFCPRSGTFGNRVSEILVAAASGLSSGLIDE